MKLPQVGPGLPQLLPRLLSTDPEFLTRAAEPRTRALVDRANNEGWNWEKAGYHAAQAGLTAYRTMMISNDRVAESLSVPLIHELQSQLTETTLPDEKRGRFRRTDEPVSVEDTTDGEVLHVPPHAGDLPRRVGLLCEFAAP